MNPSNNAVPVTTLTLTAHPSGFRHRKPSLTDATDTHTNATTSATTSATHSTAFFRFISLGVQTTFDVLFENDVMDTGELTIYHDSPGSNDVDKKTLSPYPTLNNSNL